MADEYEGYREEDEGAERTRAMSRRLFEFEADLPHTKYVLKRWETGAGPTGWKTIFGPATYAAVGRKLREETGRLEGEGYESSSDEPGEVEFRESSSAQRPSVILKV